MGTATAPERPGHDIIIGFRPIPPALEKSMRTVDRPPEQDPASLEISEYTKRAARVIAEIRVALEDREGFDAGQSSLAVAEARNAVTGTPALLLLRRLRSGQYSAPLAEMFSDSGRLEPGGIERFDRFRYDAYTHGLELFIHQADAGNRTTHRAFAVASERGNNTAFWFIARLFVTPFEVGQWKPV